MEADCFFCSDVEESRAMQKMALFLDLTRKRLLVEIVTKRQGMLRVRPLMQSTTVDPDGDAHGGGERRWGD